MTIPNFVLAEIQLSLMQILLRQFQIVFCRNSNALRRKYSKTVPNFVLAKVQLHLIGFILRHFRI